MSKVLYGLGVTVLGMVVVFIGLLILIGFIKLLSKLVSKKKAEKAAPAVAEKVEEAAPAAVEETNGISPEIIAAITAAVAAVWDKPTGFVVRHVKRNDSAWKQSVSNNQTFSRF